MSSPRVTATSPVPAVSPMPVSAVPFSRDDVVAVRGADGITVAKVIRSGPEGLVLMGMQHMQGTFYTVDVQAVWMQQDLSAVRFVDAVWNAQHQCYDVRSGIK